MTVTKPERLASLDILRGFDLFMLVGLQPVLVAVAAVWTDAPAWFVTIMRQLDHEVWEGLRCWDLVMPLFLFMVGAAMPFSFAKYRRDKSCRHSALWRRILRRVILLFLAGMLVQGNLLTLDPSRFTIYTNTLQAIAVGYLIASFILLYCDLRRQIAATLALMIIYSAGMALGGDYSPEGSWAYIVDRAILGDFRGDPTYTWIWSSLTFGATVMTGAFAGTLMRRRDIPRPKVALWLAAGGLALTAAGMFVGIWEPVIKRLWTSSMTLLAGGLCTLLMAAAYWWVDVRGHSRGLNWLKIYGMNAITAYVLGEVVNFRSIVASLTYGLQPLLGPWYEVWLTAGNFTLLFMILYYMSRRHLYLKL